MKITLNYHCLALIKRQEQQIRAHVTLESLRENYFQNSQCVFCTGFVPKTYLGLTFDQQQVRVSNNSIIDLFGGHLLKLERYRED
jgi:hypothetical protein